MAIDLSLYPMGDTIAALSTPPGRGAIAIVRMSGPDAFSIFTKITRCDARPTPRHLFRVKLYHPTEGYLLDDALGVLFPKPGSYTGEDLVEFHLHGSPPIIQSVLEVLQTLGARPAEPGEFTYRAFVHGKMDLTEAEAVNDLIRADSIWSARTALQQMEGQLKHQVQAWRENLLELIAHLEADIDFGDAEMTQFSQPDWIVHRCIELIRRLDHILTTYETGRALREGFRIVIVGRPNAGKSSLFNRMLGTERAIVTEIPGTTRDFITEKIIVDGMTLELVDTAGLRSDAEYIERLGIEQTHRKLEEADLIFWVIDRSRPLASTEDEIYAKIKDRTPWIIINKIDRPPAWDTESILEKFQPAQWFAVSCHTGQGFDRLEKDLRKTLAGYRERATTEPVLITSMRHREALSQARGHLKVTADLVREGHPLPIVLEEAHAALRQLDRLTGMTDVEEILERIFRRFCIGK